MHLRLICLAILLTVLDCSYLTGGASCSRPEIVSLPVANPYRAESHEILRFHKDILVGALRKDVVAVFERFGVNRYSIDKVFLAQPDGRRVELTARSWRPLSELIYMPDINKYKIMATIAQGVPLRV